MLANMKNFALKKISTGEIQKLKRLEFGYQRTQKLETNLTSLNKIEKMQNCFGWSVHRLSIIGKITVLKSLVASQVHVIHRLSPLQTSSQIIKQINDLFFDFLWNSRGDKIKRNVITQNYGNTGLRMIDIASFNKALKSVWIRRYLDENNKRKWKLFAMLRSKNLEAKLFLEATLT